MDRILVHDKLSYRIVSFLFMKTLRPIYNSKTIDFTILSNFSPVRAVMYSLCVKPMCKIYSQTIKRELVYSASNEVVRVPGASRHSKKRRPLCDGLSVRT